MSHHKLQAAAVANAVAVQPAGVTLDLDLDLDLDLRAGACFAVYSGTWQGLRAAAGSAVAEVCV
jgi:hypothetical protein